MALCHRIHMLGKFARFARILKLVFARFSPYAWRMEAVLVRSLLALVVWAGSLAAQLPEFKETKARAEAGDAEAQYNLGVMYDMGAATAASAAGSSWP